MWERPADEAGLESEAAVAARSPVDNAAVLVAVHNLGGDLAAIRRLLAAQPEEIAARVDADGATAALGVRIGTLGSTLDQLRLSLLASLDRTADRLDQPVWLPALLAALGELQTQVQTIAEQPSPGIAPPADDPRLDHLAIILARLADDPRLDHLAVILARILDDNRLDLVAAAVAGLAAELRAGAANDVQDVLVERLAAIEVVVGQAAADTKQLSERVDPLPERLGAIAVQIDRLTPLVRAGDEAGSLLGQLDRVSSALEEVAGSKPRHGQVAHGRASDDDLAADQESRIDTLIDVLAGVTRRQDELAAAMTSVLDQMRGPMSVDAVLDRMEQRERSLAARLDRIDTELRRRGDAPIGSTVHAVAKSDDMRPALAELAAKIERAIAPLPDRLGAIAVQVDRLAPLARADDDERFDAVIEVLAAVTRRQDELASVVKPVLDHIRRPLPPAVDLAGLVEFIAKRIDDRLKAVESKLEGATLLTSSPPTKAGAAEAARRLVKLRAERAAVQARLQHERLLAAEADEEDEEDDDYYLPR